MATKKKKKKGRKKERKKKKKMHTECEDVSGIFVKNVLN